MNFTVPEELAGRTVLSVLLNTLRLSRSSVRSLKFSGDILLGGQKVHTDRRVAAGDRLQLVFAQKSVPPPAPAQSSLSVAFEDEHYLMVDKPAPLPSVSSRHKGGETLENLVYTFLGMPDPFIYRPVNRLDKGTSGLMMVAKSAHAQHALQRLLHTDAFVREYEAVVVDRPPQNSGIIDLAISKDGAIKRRIDPGGRPARTIYQVEQVSPGHALVRLRLLTGRTHQIRVHMQHIGCPVAGDFLYGQESPLLPGRFALHACSLRFLHPFTGQWVERVSPLPDSFLQFLSPAMQESPAAVRYISETQRKEV